MRAAWLMVVACGCAPLSSSFACGSSAQCVPGVCEASGFCSFPDGACASGRRYGQLAGDGLGDRCVELADGGQSDGAEGDGGVATFSGCVQAIGGGAAHACAVLGDGTVQCWGAGSSGQLGSGLLVDQPAPLPVLDARGQPLVASSLTLGGAHSCALSATQTLACWGANDRGQLGTGAPPSPQPVPSLLGITPVSAVGAGQAHGCASVAGAVWCWGANSDGQLGDSLSGDSNLPQPTLTMGGTQLQGVSRLAAGAAHSCALLGSDVLCWGANNLGQLGDGLDVPSLPVRVVGLPATQAVAAAGDRACALAEDGGVWCWGGGQKLASQVPELTASAVAVGSGHACAVRSDGTVVCWGDNGDGQLGDGTSDDRAQPVAVLDSDGERLGGAAEVVAGDHYSCARTHGGAVLCWGDALTLGDGSGVARSHAGLVRFTCP